MWCFGREGFLLPIVFLVDFFWGGLDRSEGLRIFCLGGLRVFWFSLKPPTCLSVITLKDHKVD